MSELEKLKLKIKEIAMQCATIGHLDAGAEVGRFAMDVAQQLLLAIDDPAASA